MLSEPIQFHFQGFASCPLNNLLSNFARNVMAELMDATPVGLWSLRPPFPFFKNTTVFHLWSLGISLQRNDFSTINRRQGGCHSICASFLSPGWNPDLCCESCRQLVTHLLPRPLPQAPDSFYPRWVQRSCDKACSSWWRRQERMGIALFRSLSSVASRPSAPAVGIAFLLILSASG